MAWPPRPCRTRRSRLRLQGNVRGNCRRATNRAGGQAMSLADIPIISADSHMVEPPEMWSERVAPAYRDRAPKLVRGLNGRDAEFFTCENISPFPVAGFFGAGVR